MTDLEITRLCAEAMKLSAAAANDYWPLTDDAQAMALVKKFNMVIEREKIGHRFGENFAVTLFPERVNGQMQKICVVRDQPDLNRAICECVAKLKQGES